MGGAAVFIAGAQGEQQHRHHGADLQAEGGDHAPQTRGDY